MAHYEANDSRTALDALSPAVGEAMTLFAFPEAPREEGLGRAQVIAAAGPISARRISATNSSETFAALRKARSARFSFGLIPGIGQF
jgi:hypothetical protein